MEHLTLHLARQPLRRELAAWQKAALGLVLLSSAVNSVFSAALLDARAQIAGQAAQLEQVESARDYAIEQLGALARQAEADKQARAEQAAAYEAIGAYTYIGECTITAYCPCEACCGQWADGATASGLPAMPGIVAVDPEVIPMGSTVFIDGQRYLAADTGVTGLHVDVCMSDHAATVEAGVRTAEVWVVTK